MQRVAIARALVNDPEILLADEPTGALDSDTSIQVMDLLQEVAKERLVVMVTHNPELAELYANRIVTLRDGVICSDTNPFEPDSETLLPPKHKNMGKSSMSFLTALSLSFNNLRTKKARTLLTSFAGSIGIIGIALILALSSGVNEYIQNMEEETLSEYPLQIQSTGFDLTSMMVGSQNAGKDSKDSGKKNEIKVQEVVTNMFSTMNSNDLASLKKYLGGGADGISDYTNAIEYSYSVTPQIYREDGDSIRQVHPDQSFRSLGLGASSNSIMSSMMSTNVFYEMPDTASLYENQYDLKAGHWPENYNECVLVLTSDGGMSDFLLYTLGLRDALELDEMVRQFLNEETVETPSSIGTYSYDDILGTTFRLVNSADCYEYDSQYQVWKDKSDNEDYMKKLVANGEKLTITGIVQPSPDSAASALTAGINYPASLTRHVVEEAKKSEIVKQQMADSSIDVFTEAAWISRVRLTSVRSLLISTDCRSLILARFYPGLLSMSVKTACRNWLPASWRAIRATPRSTRRRIIPIYRRISSPTSIPRKHRKSCGATSRPSLQAAVFPLHRNRSRNSFSGSSKGIRHT